ncbi:MAPEG family protein [Roseobacteraceae bacterium S113]
MTPMISALFWNTVLLVGLLILQPGTRVAGMGWTYSLSNMDQRQTEIPFARRLALAKSNQLEALIKWGLLILIGSVSAAEFANQNLSLIALGFVVARVAYVAVTLLGIPVIRSSIWAIGLLLWFWFAWEIASNLQLGF